MRLPYDPILPLYARLRKERARVPTPVELDGQLYDVMGVVRHSETLEALVLYRPQIGDGTVWVRPWAMFFEQVETDGQQRPRFERLP